MDMNLRDWLIIIGILIIVVILDGYRRMRKAKLQAQLMSLYKPDGNADDYNSELPNGGARVIKRKEPDFDCPSPQQRELPFNNTPHSKKENSSEQTMIKSAVQPMIDNHKVEQNVQPTTAIKNERRRRSANIDAKQENKKSKEKQVNPKEVIIINVLSDKDKPYSGKFLLHNLLANGLKYGNMGIFHRHEKNNGEGDILFSAANGVEPGTFDLDTMTNKEFSAISFFIGLPGPKQPVRAFEQMMQTVRSLVKESGGELYDENHSIMSKQTLQHCKQKLIAFERHQLTYKE